MNQTPGGTPDIGELFLVGDLHVDVGQQRVTRADIEIPMSNLSFELLLALIRIAPHFLSNDLLMERVWPGLIVSPETVAKRVNLLRVALGDDAKDPRYIAGVRNRGYRLVPVLSAPGRIASGPTAPRPPLRSGPPPRVARQRPTRRGAGLSNPRGPSAPGVRITISSVRYP